LAEVSASWSFAITETACVATASSRDVSLTVRVDETGHVGLNLAATALRTNAVHSGVRGRVRFEGREASWTLSARTDNNHHLVVALNLNQRSAKDVLVMLGGGTLRTELTNAEVPVLRLPVSNVSGRDWFECVRERVRRVSS
jgi:hypothetical protein